MKIAICDDEKQCVEYIGNLLLKNNETDVACYDDIDIFMTDIENNREFDLIFLDIKYPNKKKDGIDYAQKVCGMFPTSQIVFVTGYNNAYSQEIFRQGINLCGFLVKPVSPKRLVYLLEKARDNLQNSNDKCLALKVGKSMRMLPYNRIVYLESHGHKVTIHTEKENIEIYDKLDSVFEQLPGTFVRNHKSFAVALSYISKIEGNTIELTDGRKVPVSRVKREETISLFLKYVKEKMEQ